MKKMLFAASAAALVMAVTGHQTLKTEDPAPVFYKARLENGALNRRLEFGDSLMKGYCVLAGEAAV